MRNRVQGAKILGLLIITGLAVTYVRHDLQTHHAAWDSFEQFFSWWFTHTMGIMLFIVIAGVAITMSHEFFLGSKFDDSSKFDDKFQQLFFYILMAVLVASLSFWLLGHHVFASDDSDPFDAAANDSFDSVLHSSGGGCMGMRAKAWERTGGWANRRRHLMFG
jgi:hypothetical protein